MSLLGLLSLSGVLMKNQIVLLDQINIELAKETPLMQAVIDSAVSHIRSVNLAAFTTVLGMVPLLWDALPRRKGNIQSLPYDLIKPNSDVFLTYIGKHWDARNFLKFFTLPFS
jgi:hypothetical protein